MLEGARDTMRSAGRSSSMVWPLPSSSCIFDGAALGDGWGVLVGGSGVGAISSAVAGSVAGGTVATAGGGLVAVAPGKQALAANSTIRTSAAAARVFCM